MTIYQPTHTQRAAVRAILAASAKYDASTMVIGRDGLVTAKYDADKTLNGPETTRYTVAHIDDLLADDLRTQWEVGRQLYRAAIASWPATAVPMNSFAEACYDGNNLTDLVVEWGAQADTTDCKAWDLTPGEWARQIGVAYEARLQDQEEA